jgi:hypothetical protein
MKSGIALLVSILGFILVWAAGHDILKGESDVLFETMVVIGGFLLASIGLVALIRKWASKHRDG